jgi:hypothetical protein
MGAALVWYQSVTRGMAPALELLSAVGVGAVAYLLTLAALPGGRSELTRTFADILTSFRPNAYSRAA